MGSIAKINNYDEKFKNQIKILELNSWGLFGFLFHSSLNAQFNKFYQENKNELHKMSGDNILIFDFNLKSEEKESKMPNIKNYINSDIPKIHRTIYDVADELGIPYEDFPCLVFFYNFKNRKVGIYQLKDETADFKTRFEELFTIIRDCCKKNPKRNRKKNFNCLKKNLRNKKIKKILKSIGTWVKDNVSISKFLKLSKTS